MLLLAASQPAAATPATGPADASAAQPSAVPVPGPHRDARRQTNPSAEPLFDHGMAGNGFNNGFGGPGFGGPGMGGPTLKTPGQDTGR
jgi:hypothetical protein